MEINQTQDTTDKTELKDRLKKILHGFDFSDKIQKASINTAQYKVEKKDELTTDNTPIRKHDSIRKNGEVDVNKLFDFGLSEKINGNTINQYFIPASGGENTIKESILTGKYTNINPASFVSNSSANAQENISSYSILGNAKNKNFALNAINVTKNNPIFNFNDNKRNVQNNNGDRQTEWSYLTNTVDNSNEALTKNNSLNTSSIKNENANSSVEGDVVDTTKNKNIENNKTSINSSGSKVSTFNASNSTKNSNISNLQNIVDRQLIRKINSIENKHNSVNSPKIINTNANSNRINGINSNSLYTANTKTSNNTTVKNTLDKNNNINNASSINDVNSLNKNSTNTIIKNASITSNLQRNIESLESNPTSEDLSTISNIKKIENSSSLQTSNSEFSSSIDKRSNGSISNKAITETDQTSKILNTQNTANNADNTDITNGTNNLIFVNPLLNTNVQTRIDTVQNTFKSSNKILGDNSEAISGKNTITNNTEKNSINTSGLEISKQTYSNASNLINNNNNNDVDVQKNSKVDKTSISDVVKIDRNEKYNTTNKVDAARNSTISNNQNLTKNTQPKNIDSRVISSIPNNILYGADSAISFLSLNKNKVITNSYKITKPFVENSTHANLITNDSPTVNNNESKIRDYKKLSFSEFINSENNIAKYSTADVKTVVSDTAERLKVFQNSIKDASDKVLINDVRTDNNENTSSQTSFISLNNNLNDKTSTNDNNVIDRTNNTAVDKATVNTLNLIDTTSNISDKQTVNDKTSTKDNNVIDRTNNTLLDRISEKTKNLINNTNSILVNKSAINSNNLLDTASSNETITDKEIANNNIVDKVLTKTNNSIEQINNNNNNKTTDFIVNRTDKLIDKADKLHTVINRTAKSTPVSINSFKIISGEAEQNLSSITNKDTADFYINNKSSDKNNNFSIEKTTIKSNPLLIDNQRIDSNNIKSVITDNKTSNSKENVLNRSKTAIRNISNRISNISEGSKQNNINSTANANYTASNLQWIKHPQMFNALTTTDGSNSSETNVNSSNTTSSNKNLFSNPKTTNIKNALVSNYGEKINSRNGIVNISKNNIVDLRKIETQYSSGDDTTTSKNTKISNFNSKSNKINNKNTNNTQKTNIKNLNNKNSSTSLYGGKNTNSPKTTTIDEKTIVLHKGVINTALNNKNNFGYGDVTKYFASSKNIENLKNNTTQAKSIEGDSVSNEHNVDFDHTFIPSNSVMNEIYEKFYSRTTNKLGKTNVTNSAFKMINLNTNDRTSSSTTNNVNNKSTTKNNTPTTSSLPALRAGGYVKTPTVAYLHENEAVVPLDKSKEFSQFVSEIKTSDSGMLEKNITNNDVSRMNTESMSTKDVIKEMMTTISAKLDSISKKETTKAAASQRSSGESIGPAAISSPESVQGNNNVGSIYGGSGSTNSFFGRTYRIPDWRTRMG